MIEQNTIEDAINRACAYLYEKQKHLVEEHAHERTIAGDVIAPYLRNELRGWDVTTEYNREGERRIPKRDLENKLLIPDIIIHKHGPDGPNVAVVQVKGHWNSEDRRKDEHFLHRIQAKHGYQFLYRLELEADEYQLIRVP